MEEAQAVKEKNSTKKKKLWLTPRLLRYAVATMILLLVISGISAVFVMRVYLMTESSCYDDLAVETEDAITALETNLRSDKTMLRVIAGLIGNTGDINSIEVSGYLANYDINNLITQIGILLPENEVVSANGRRSNPNGALSFEEESLQGEHISGSQSFRNDSSAMMLRSYVPIRKDGICIGLLFSAANSSSVAKAWIPSIYDKQGYCYVVDRKTGTVLINTASDKITDINDISFIQTEKDYSKQDTIANILDGRKGYSVFRSKGSKESLYMCYLPFSIEDWEMVVFVPESAVFSAVTPVRNGLYAIIATAAAILLLYGIWVIREIRASVIDAETKANTDVLTGLPNRNRYEDYLKQLEGTGGKLLCLFIDANGLHELNNSEGHFAGDQMLRFIADTLKVQFGGEHIYRIGGDEFVVFLSGKTAEEMSGSLESFNEALTRNNYHAAVGICEYGDGMSIDQLIGSAEKDMYEAKQRYYEQLGRVMRV